MSGLSTNLSGGMRLALDAALPNGTNLYVALLTVAPNEDGSGYTEVTDAWYARIAISSWIFQKVGDTVVRKTNKAAVQFAANTSGATVTVVAIGIFDALTAGNLIAHQPTRTVAGVEAPLVIPDTDDALVAAEMIKVGIGPKVDITTSPSITTEDTVQTLDATPTVLRIAATLGTDGDSVHIRAIVRGKSTTLNKNFYRVIEKSYHRDDADAGTEIWSVRDMTTDGIDTRAPGNTPLTTATADLILTGNRVDLQVTGEAATVINWAAEVKVIQD